MHHLVQPEDPADPCDPLEAHLKLFCDDLCLLEELGEWLKNNPPQGGCEGNFADWLAAAIARAIDDKEDAQAAVDNCRNNPPESGQ